nr:RNA methyltransferase [Maribacter sp. HTCC2170]
MFAVEGIKSVKELLNSNIEAHKVYCVNPSLIENESGLVELISAGDFKKISTLKNPNGVLGVFIIPKPKVVDQNDWLLALDDVRDPGNLGTIIRLCDWFGIKNLLCSENTVDCFNPKVLQASMGSITRVNVVYTDLVTFLEQTKLPVYGTFMNAASVYNKALPKKGILVMGNEGNGISSDIENLVNSKISIPQFGDKATESLNVASATSIFLSEIRRV